MALIGDAKFIILDEPTSNLDLKSREKIWSLIKKIAQQKERCILISTQHIEEADFIGTKICIIKDGELSQYDTPENLKRKFGNGFKVKMVSDETRH
jgi:ABC-type multidrug transport system ATPase subunit